jgi:hypothetical protein
MAGHLQRGQYVGQGQSDDRTVIKGPRRDEQRTLYPEVLAGDSASGNPPSLIPVEWKAVGIALITSRTGAAKELIGSGLSGSNAHVALHARPRSGQRHPPGGTYMQQRRSWQPSCASIPQLSLTLLAQPPLGSSELVDLVVEASGRTPVTRCAEWAFEPPIASSADV